MSSSTFFELSSLGSISKGTLDLLTADDPDFALNNIPPDALLSIHAELFPSHDTVSEDDARKAIIELFDEFETTNIILGTLANAENIFSCNGPTSSTEHNGPIGLLYRSHVENENELTGSLNGAQLPGDVLTVDQLSNYINASTGSTARQLHSILASLFERINKSEISDSKVNLEIDGRTIAINQLVYTYVDNNNGQLAYACSQSLLPYLQKKVNHLNGLSSDGHPLIELTKCCRILGKFPNSRNCKKLLSRLNNLTELYPEIREEKIFSENSKLGDQRQRIKVDPSLMVDYAEFLRGPENPEFLSPRSISDRIGLSIVKERTVHEVALKLYEESQKISSGNKRQNKKKFPDSMQIHHDDFILHNYSNKTRIEIHRKLLPIVRRLACHRMGYSEDGERLLSLEKTCLELGRRPSKKATHYLSQKLLNLAKSHPDLKRDDIIITTTPGRSKSKPKIMVRPRVLEEFKEHLKFKGKLNRQGIDFNEHEKKYGKIVGLSEANRILGKYPSPGANHTLGESLKALLRIDKSLKYKGIYPNGCYSLKGHRRCSRVATSILVTHREFLSKKKTGIAATNRELGRDPSTANNRELYKTLMKLLASSPIKYKHLIHTGATRKVMGRDYCSILVEPALLPELKAIFATNPKLMDCERTQFLTVAKFMPFAYGVHLPASHPHRKELSSFIENMLVNHPKTVVYQEGNVTLTAEDAIKYFQTASHPKTLCFDTRIKEFLYNNFMANANEDSNFCTGKQIFHDFSMPIKYTPTNLKLLKEILEFIWRHERNNHVDLNGDRVRITSLLKRCRSRRHGTEFYIRRDAIGVILSHRILEGAPSLLLAL